MKKEITQKKAFKAMKTIKRYCEDQKKCSERCIFFRDTLFNRCRISMFVAPAQWDTTAVKKKMEAEKCGKQ